MTCKPPLVQLSNVLLFADDIKCYKSTSSVSESSLLQSDLDLLRYWCSDWNLSLNATKCNLHFHMKYTSIISSNYCVNGSSVTTSACHEDLGIIVFDDLSSSSHYHYISSRAYIQISWPAQAYLLQIQLHLYEETAVHDTGNITVTLLLPLYGDLTWLKTSII